METSNTTPSRPSGSRRALALAAAFALAFIIIGSLIGAATGPASDGWYAGLVKSTLNPPGWIFGVVWPILYALIGISTALIWLARDKPAARAALVLMGVQMLLNYAWSFIFFRLHLIDLAFWWILLVAAMVALLIALAWRIRPIAAVLLLPYVAWLGFAAYLAGTIRALN